MFKPIRICLFAAGLTLASGVLFAQSAAEASKTSSSDVPAVSAIAASSATGSKAVVKHHEHLPAGDHPVENADEEENSQFKYSPTVRSLAHKTGLSKEAVYWIFVAINFAILVGCFGWILKKMMPHGFAPRTAEIQKEIEEARKASAEASARLSEIEGRLAKLDAEVAEIRVAAETDFSVEEQRIKTAAEQDASNVIAAAEQEIAAAARIAQRELKAFVADLAVGMAEKKIKVDDNADRSLIRGFAAQLGKDGR